MPKWLDLPSATAITALLAIYAAALSTVNFLDQRYETRNQLLLSTKPHVDFDIEDDADQPPVGIAIRNSGPGPAIIKSVRFYVDRKSVKDADEAGITYGKLSSKELDYQEFEPGESLAVGENFWLIRYRKPRGGRINQKNMEAFSDFIDQNLAIEIVFCSPIDENLCWQKCSTKGRCQ